MAAARWRCATPRPSMGGAVQHFVLLEPADHLIPRVVSRPFAGVRRCLAAVARPVVGVEAVRRAGIDLEFGGLFSGLEFFFHLLDLLDLDAGVLGAVETEHW